MQQCSHERHALAPSHPPGQCECRSSKINDLVS
uniref:Uncharacterized protein n=1 Tax=Arundo donax TaxID=35708 RepID=A0A0A8ZKY0_ARUDO